MPACRPRKDNKMNTITFSYKLLSANALPDVNGTANTVARKQRHEFAAIRHPRLHAVSALSPL